MHDPVLRIEQIHALEFASYLLWNNQISKKISYTAGCRYDYSTEYGSTINPRFAFVFSPIKSLTIKLLYGRAFRQPSIFELTSEWRGNEIVNCHY